MRKLITIMLSLMLILSMAGCSKGTATQEDYDALQTKLDTATKKSNALQTQVDTLSEENEKLKEQVASTETAKEEPVKENITNKELEKKLLEQPMYVASTEYLVQSEDLKALYPDMLNAVIKNTSGADVKNAQVAFVAWDENNFPVKIKGQYDFDDGSYVRECDFGDVNMVDGSTFGEDQGLSLSSDINNIKTIKAIVFEYTDFDGNKWENPYYRTWKSLYENKKTEK